MRSAFPGIFLFLLSGTVFAEDARVDDSGFQDFDHDIAPLIAQHCLSCHSGPEPKGKLDLSSRETAMSGGESGRVIEAGNPDGSLLWQNIDSDQMPPKKPIPAAEKARLKKWIADGAKWGTEKIDPFRFTTDARAGSDWWSLQPLGNPEPPSIDYAGWTENPIDAFVYTGLRDAGLTPAPEADRRTLVRRLSFDLLGLPPTPAQIDAFLADNSEHAVDSLVDQLLGSPHYGERWARHWLDVVRFGESNGFEYDEPRNNFWHYRNWVIIALNQDMPYDEFVRLQLAGDVMRPDDISAIAAAGFLVAGPHNTTLPASATRLRREVIFAERKFVATPLAIGLRIGGAAEFAGLEAPPNYRRSDALLQLARRYLPGLDESGAQKWMGHRPATPDSLPVIGASGTSPRVFYAFGHGHLGLTQSVTTGELIGELLAGVTSSVDLAPYAITRF